MCRYEVGRNYLARAVVRNLNRSPNTLDVAEYADFSKLASKESDIDDFYEVLVLGDLPLEDVIATKMAIRRAWGARRESDRKENDNEKPDDTKKTSGDIDFDSDADVETDPNARRALLDEFRKRR